MEEPKTVYISVTLDGKSIDEFSFCKEKTGIKNNSDVIRFLISQYAKDK